MAVKKEREEKARQQHERDWRAHQEPSQHPI
jgi:hypothetical protein